MAFLFTQAAVWLAILLHVFSAQAASSFWTYTSRYQMSTSYHYYTYRTYVQTYTYSDMTRTIKPSVIPTAAPFSVETASGIYTVANLELVYEWYNGGAVAESQLLPDTIYGTARATDYASSTYTYWYMDVVYTAPATCSSQFTFSTTRNVVIPTQVQDQMKPTSAITSGSYVTAFLTTSAAPYTSNSDFYYTNYVQSCINPLGSLSTGSPKNGDGLGYSSCYYNCNVLKVWVIVIAVILPTLFLLGFLESWFWFRRLMTGRGAMRFGTISWIGISLWVVCFTRFQSARSQNDQKLLYEKWKAMSGGTAFKLWWKWGFKHRYPTELLGEYSRNDSGVPGVAGAAVPPMPFAHEKGGPPPPGPLPFINHNGIIYIPQSQQSPYAPQATSYLDCGGIIYVPQALGYPPPSAVSSNSFIPPPHPQAYQTPQGYTPPVYYEPAKAMPSTGSHTPAPPTEVSSLTHSPPNQHVQPALSEVSGFSSQTAAEPGQVVYNPPVEGHRPENAPEWVPPKNN